jgi:cytidylate kinase
MIITIDGPAGTGKSTVAQAVAQRLGFDFLDTGAMYRAIGLEALRREADLSDLRELAFVARHSSIEFDWSRRPPGVLLKGEPVGHLLRGADATRAASFVAVVPRSGRSWSGSSSGSGGSGRTSSPRAGTRARSCSPRPG